MEALSSSAMTLYIFQNPDNYTNFWIYNFGLIAFVRIMSYEMFWLQCHLDPGVAFYIL
jgi:hypothetical protein